MLRDQPRLLASGDIFLTAILNERFFSSGPELEILKTKTRAYSLMSNRFLLVQDFESCFLSFYDRINRRSMKTQTKN
jgi:hypothetical protein